MEAEAPAAPTNITFIASFGGPGLEEGRFRLIGGVAARGGRVYVGDQRLSRVQVFDYFGKFLGSWGCGLDTKDFGVTDQKLALNPQASEAELMSAGVVEAIVRRDFFRPFDVAVYEGDVLVLNNFRSRVDATVALMTPEILRFSPQGELRERYPISAMLPGFIAVDEANHRAACSDYMNNAFVVYDLVKGELAGSSRKLLQSSYESYLHLVVNAPTPEQQVQRLREWTLVGSGEGQFDLIGGLAFYSAQSAEGETVDMVLAVDTNNNRLQIFTAEGKHLQTIAGAEPGKRSLFTSPVDVAVTAKGVVYLTDQDPKMPAVSVFSSRFELLYKLVHPDMAKPAYLDITPDGFIFVSDLATNQVFVFGPTEAKLKAGAAGQTGEPEADPGGGGTV